jgi:hypothetical protein
MTAGTEAAEEFILSLPASTREYGRVYMRWLLAGAVPPAPERRSAYANHPGLQVGNVFAEGVEKSLCAALGLPWADVEHAKAMPIPGRRSFGEPWPYGRLW